MERRRELIPQVTPVYSVNSNLPHHLLHHKHTESTLWPGCINISYRSSDTATLYMLSSVSNLWQWYTTQSFIPCLGYTVQPWISFTLWLHRKIILHHVHKKLYPCICCHNSGKQCQILTKFYANTVRLNCKQVTKFQQNQSTSATATTSLVRSLKGVQYRHRRDCQVCIRANGKTSAHLKSVFYRTQARRRGRHCLTTSSTTTWWKCSHSLTRRDFSWSTSRIWLWYTRFCSFPQIW